MSWEEDPDDERIVKRLDNVESVLLEILEVLKSEKNPIKEIRIQDSYSCRCGAIINGHENVKEHLVLGCDAYYEKYKHMLIYPA